jgi:hypothetical protein
MSTGESSWVGFPPKVLVVERMTLSMLPEAEREPFLQFAGSRVEYTRTNEPVFPKGIYEAWKRLRK